MTLKDGSFPVFLFVKGYVLSEIHIKIVKNIRQKQKYNILIYNNMFKIRKFLYSTY